METVANGHTLGSESCRDETDIKHFDVGVGE